MYAYMALFVGNVLPDITSTEGEDDVSFDFNEAEARALDLKGVPIRIEHEEGLAVGRVLRSWNGVNGEKWVVGELDNNTLESRYARYAIRPTERTGGHTLYKGLSLQHVWRGHKASNGKLVGRGEKKPIEISICADPRRPNCFIRHVASSNKREYKGGASLSHTMSTESTPAPVESTPAPVESAPAPEAAAAPAAEVPQDRDELMRAILSSEEERASAAAQAEEFKGKYEALVKQMEEQKKNEQIALRTKADNLSRALVDSWTSQLNPEDLTDDTKKAIFALAQNYPEESVKMMEIAHKASKRSAALEQQLESAKQQSERSVLETQVAAVLNKKRARPAFPTVEQEIHRASKKSAPVASNPFLAPTLSQTATNMRESNPALFEALASMKRGSARSSMDAVAKMYQ